MYVGRIVSVARTQEGRLCAAYRVSSRSFPNRTAILEADKVSIVPKAGHESDLLRNPYIAYNCLRIVCNGDVAVVTNGSQTDAIAEKVEAGMSVRDAIAIVSLALDYEKDSYNTPRISAAVDKRTGVGWLGIVRHDGLQVERIPLDFGRIWYVATYEENTISSERGDDFPEETAQGACAYLLRGGVFAWREHPVTAVAAVSHDEGFSLAVMDVDSQ